MRADPRPSFSPEAAVLGAIHTFAASGAPRLHRLLPSLGCPGQPVLLEGEGLGTTDLTADFGGCPSWVVALSDRLALSVVPAGAAAGPLTVSRHGLRSNNLFFGGPSDDTPARVVRVDPMDGATGVFKDAPVVARLSLPADPSSLTAETFHVMDAEGMVPARLRVSPDASVIIWQAERLLRPDTPHFVIASGLRDQRGRSVTPHLSRFVPCDVSRGDLGV